MSDLTCSTEQLTGLGSKLTGLKQSMKSTDGHASFHTDTLGHHRVVDAMNDFRGNWNDHRDHLADNLGTLGDLATKAAEGFTKADADLAAKIRESLQRS